MDREEFKDLIRSQVVTRDKNDAPLVHRSGRRLTGGWLFDFRRVLLQPMWLRAYADIFWERYADRYPFQVGGIESAGLALVAAIVMKGTERGTPVNGFFVRKSRKKDGLMKTVEGDLTNDPIILVDDVLNTGTSAMKQVLALADLGKHTSELFSIVAFRTADEYTFITRHGTTISWLYSLAEFDLALSPQDAGPPHNTLQTLWRFRSPHPSLQHVTEKSAPLVAGGRVFFGTDCGALYALSLDTGTVEWEFRATPDRRGKGIFSTPAAFDEKLYFGAYDGNVYALDQKTGEIVWSYRTADWVGSSPTIDTKRRIVFIGLEFATPTRRGAVAALCADSGSELWISDLDDFVHASPLYVRSTNAVFAGDNAGTVRAHRADTGEILWSRNVGGAVKASFAFEEERGLLYFGSFDGYLYAFDARSGEVVFAFKTKEPIFSTPLVRSDLVYVASLDKNLYALDAASGVLKWSHHTDGRIFSTPVIADGSLWLGSNDACLYEISPDTGATLSVQHFSERIVNAVSFDESRALFVIPTIANEIYCARKRLPSQ